MGGAKPGERRGGRQRGTPNRTTVATRERIAQEADPVGLLIRVSRGELIEAAPAKDVPDAVPVRPTLDQRLHAAGLLARKIAPDPKDAPVSLALPPIATAADFLAAMAEVVAAMGAGRITPSEAQACAAVVEAQRKSFETVEIERRIRALEEGKDAGNRAPAGQA